MNRRLTLMIILLAGLFLAGCRAVPDPWQTWIGELVEGAPSPVPIPSTGDEAPPLAPTPTLAAGAVSTDAPADQAAPQATTPSQDGPAEDDPSAAEEPATEEESPPNPAPGAFTGAFAGTIQGHNDSSASLDLILQQNGRQIEGVATLGEGLVVNAGGVCGSFPIPATTLTARDELDQVDGRHLLTTTTVQVSGLEIPVELEAILAPDGQTVTAQATIYPPALCGNTPTLNAELMRVEGGS